MAELNNLDENFLSSLTPGHSLEALIGAPLTAVSKANSMMLSSQSKFILDFCFNYSEGYFSPVMIKMKLESEDGKDRFFGLPLLTLLPFNSLAVDKVNIGFNIEITSTARQSLAANSNAISDSATNGTPSTRLGAKIGASTSKNEKERKVSNIAVDLVAKQIPLPKGINTIIDMYSKNIVFSEK